jgi:FkbH-like protein
VKNLKYSEILEENKRLENRLKGNRYEITILSNIITHQLNEILEYHLRTEDINARAQSGDYDNIVQDSEKIKNSNLVIIFWELANIVDGLQHKANLMNDDEIETLLSKMKAEIDFVLMNLKEVSLVIFNKFSSLIFDHENIKKNNLDKVCAKLNEYLEQKASSNIMLIDIDKVIANISVQKCVDFRYYYSSKALYTIEFYKNYAEYIKPIILAANGKAKKVLVFDCDNTLWKGVIGEDGFDGVEMSNRTERGVVFEEVQHLALELEKRGILLGLCSKNNLRDVNEVIADHPDMEIRDKHITIKKINWDDKATNLEAIANELNVGLDSLVFVEDSDFEADYIKRLLPQVTVLQVPKKLHEYPKMIREHMCLFFNLSESSEDMRKTEIYGQQTKRRQEKSKFSNLDDYLKSLELKLKIYLDDKSIIPRMSQMTQKTNQFSLTTKRYTEADIEKFVAGDQYNVLAFNVRDKFGDCGITGLCIIELDHKNKKANIDSFLMSCRIIGRNVEFCAFDLFMEYLKQREVGFVEAQYIKTIKNQQVEDFYERLGFILEKDSGNEKSYQLQLSQYMPKNLDYIGVSYG